MIYQLCNQGNEQIATFNQIAIIKKSSLANFTHLTADDTIEQIITDLPDSSNVILVDLLPENMRLSYTTRIKDTIKKYMVNASLTITPQDKNMQALMEDYNNQEVIFLLYKNGSTNIYGTPQTPLFLTYSEQHSNQGEGLKGYDVSIVGDCLGASKIFESITFNIFSRGLAFELAQAL